MYKQPRPPMCRAYGRHQRSGSNDAEAKQGPSAS